MNAVGLLALIWKVRSVSHRTAKIGLTRIPKLTRTA